MRVRGPVLWLRQQQSGKLRVANREKVKLVDPHLNWDEITPRPRRTQRRPRAVIGGAPIIRPPQTTPNGPNLPDNVPPLKLCRRNRRWAIDGRASIKRPAPDVPHRRQRGRYMLRRTPK